MAKKKLKNRIVIEKIRSNGVEKKVKKYISDGRVVKEEIISK